MNLVHCCRPQEDDHQLDHTVKPNAFCAFLWRWMLCFHVQSAERSVLDGPSSPNLRVVRTTVTRLGCKCGKHTSASPVATAVRDNAVRCRRLNVHTAFNATEMHKKHLIWRYDQVDDRLLVDDNNEPFLLNGHYAFCSQFPAGIANYSNQISIRFSRYISYHNPVKLP